MRRGKYEELIDGETWAFVDRMAEWYPPETTGFPIERQRAIYDELCRAFRGARPPGVRASDSAIETPGRALPVRHYSLEGATPEATVLYFHGGGFVLGGLDSHDDICAELCAGTGYEVISVDYRLAPEHRHPAAFDDARAAFAWAAAASDLAILLCGESAGGNLAAAVAQAQRGQRRAAAGQVLIYPELGGDTRSGSYVEHSDAPLLTLQEILFYRETRAGNPTCANDPTLAPLRDRDFSGLPPTVIFTAECDPLSSDGEAYRDRILAAGGRAWWHEEPGLVHGYLRARHSVARARAGFARIVAALAALGKGDWPY